MTLLEAQLGQEYLIRSIATEDEELNAFLFSLGCYSGEPITVVSHKRNSCVVAIKDGRYYFMWSEGGWTGPDYCVAYAIADNPLGPFERIGKILEQDPDIGTGAGHHSVIYNEKKDKWYIIYHRHPLGSTDGNDREVCIDEMHFDENGYILPVKMTFEGVKR